MIRPAMRAGVRRVVKLSVLAADERSPVQLARWHRQAETEVASSGLGYTILRPPFFMQNFFAMVSNGAIHTGSISYAGEVDTGRAGRRGGGTPEELSAAREVGELQFDDLFGD